MIRITDAGLGYLSIAAIICCMIISIGGGFNSGCDHKQEVVSSVRD